MVVVLDEQRQEGWGVCVCVGGGCTQTHAGHVHKRTQPTHDACLTSTLPRSHTGERTHSLNSLYSACEGIMRVQRHLNKTLSEFFCSS